MHTALNVSFERQNRSFKRHKRWKTRSFSSRRITAGCGLYKSSRHQAPGLGLFIFAGLHGGDLAVPYPPLVNEISSSSENV